MYPELVNNHINFLLTELHGIARYNESKKVLTFTNGATIKFGYCKFLLDKMKEIGFEIVNGTVIAYMDDDGTAVTPKRARKEGFPCA